MTKIIFDLDKWFAANSELMLNSIVYSSTHGNTPANVALSALVESLKTAPKLSEVEANPDLTADQIYAAIYTQDKRERGSL